jgi:hypothetical protein
VLRGSAVVLGDWLPCGSRPVCGRRPLLGPSGALRAGVRGSVGALGQAARRGQWCVEGRAWQIVGALGGCLAGQWCVGAVLAGRVLRQGSGALRGSAVVWGMAASRCSGMWGGGRCRSSALGTGVQRGQRLCWRSGGSVSVCGEAVAFAVRWCVGTGRLAGQCGKWLVRGGQCCAWGGVLRGGPVVGCGLFVAVGVGRSFGAQCGCVGECGRCGWFPRPVWLLCATWCCCSWSLGVCVAWVGGLAVPFGLWLLLVLPLRSSRLGIGLFGSVILSGFTSLLGGRPSSTSLATTLLWGTGWSTRCGSGPA